MRLAGSLLAPMFFVFAKIGSEEILTWFLRERKIEREVLLFYSIPTSSYSGVKPGVWLHSLSIQSLCQSQSLAAPAPHHPTGSFERL